jgi:hypothetical protein
MQLAEAWGFKTQDIKRKQKNVTVSPVFDSLRAKDISKTILDRVADLPIPSNQIGSLGELLSKAGIPGRRK